MTGWRILEKTRERGRKRGREGENEGEGESEKMRERENGRMRVYFGHGYFLLLDRLTHSLYQCWTTLLKERREREKLRERERN